MTKLTAAQFDALAQISRLRVGSGKYIALYQHLVNGATLGDASRLAGIKYSSAWDAAEAAKINIDLCKTVAYPLK